MDKNHLYVIAQLCPYAKNPIIEKLAACFVEFARDQRLPFSKSLIPLRARTIVHALGLDKSKHRMVGFRDIAYVEYPIILSFAW